MQVYEGTVAPPAQVNPPNAERSGQSPWFQRKYFPPPPACAARAGRRCAFNAFHICGILGPFPPKEVLWGSPPDYFGLLEAFWGGYIPLEKGEKSQRGESALDAVRYAPLLSLRTDLFFVPTVRPLSAAVLHLGLFTLQARTGKFVSFDRPYTWHARDARQVTDKLLATSLVCRYS